MMTQVLEPLPLTWEIESVADEPTVPQGWLQVPSASQVLQVDDASALSVPLT